LDKL